MNEVPAQSYLPGIEKLLAALWARWRAEVAGRGGFSELQNLTCVVGFGDIDVATYNAFIALVPLTDSYESLLRELVVLDQHAMELERLEVMFDQEVQEALGRPFTRKASYGVSELQLVCVQGAAGEFQGVETVQAALRHRTIERHVFVARVELLTSEWRTRLSLRYRRSWAETG